MYYPIRHHYVRMGISPLNAWIETTDIPQDNLNAIGRPRTSHFCDVLVRKCECARAPNSRSEHRQSTKCECARAQTKFNAVKIEAPSHFAHSHNRTLCGDTKCKFANVRKCSSTFALSHKHFALLVLCGDTLNRLAAQERKSDKGERLDSTLTCIHVALIWREGTTSTTYNTVLFSYHQSIRNRSQNYCYAKTRYYRNPVRIQFEN